MVRQQAKSSQVIICKLLARVLDAGSPLAGTLRKKYVFYDGYLSQRSVYITLATENLFLLKYIYDIYLSVAL